MDRSEALAALRSELFDVVIVGGGIFGAAMAWRATSAGLTVALVEQRDFASGTSSQHFRMLHGGIRYLQHGDIVRVRESVRARRAFFRATPHLVDPLPIVIPTYKGFKKGRFLLGLGMWLYDLVAWDRNKGVRSRDKYIPRGRLLSKEHVTRLFPGTARNDLTGGAQFYDGQMYNPARVVLAFLQSAAAKGACCANYVQVQRFLRDGKGRVTGVAATDTEGGGLLEVRGKLVVNAAGPWAPWLLGQQSGLADSLQLHFSRDTCFLINRQLDRKHALAVLGRHRDPDALLSRDARHLFIVPWRGSSLVGVWHKVCDRPPGEVAVSEQELRSFIEEVNGAYPELNIRKEEVVAINWGLTLFGDNASEEGDLSYGKRSKLVDHAAEDGIEGLVSLVGVRATTALEVAGEALRLISGKLGVKTGGTAGAETAHGGDCGPLAELTAEIVAAGKGRLEQAVAQVLARNYGSAYGEVLAYIGRHPELGECLDGSQVPKACVAHAVDREMARSLADVVMRRTDLGGAVKPSEKALREAAGIMAERLGWSEADSAEQLAKVNAHFDLHAPSGARG